MRLRQLAASALLAWLTVTAAGHAQAPSPAAAGAAPVGADGESTPADPPATAPAPAPVAAATPFDAEAATRAYLDRMPAADRARSDAYFEGGYWLELWGLLYGLGVAWLLLASGLSVRLRDQAARITPFRPLRNLLYAAGYLLLVSALGFPLTLYDDFFREHQYGLSNQSFGEWMGDYGKGLLVTLIFLSPALVALFAILRRAPRTWWAWGSVLGVALLAFGLLVAPVYIDPLFNRYERLDDPRVREPILRMAQANGVPVDDVWVFDASRQSKRISANVSGLLGTERIRLNDNLLERTSLPEIEAVMGHELGHYVLNHIYESLLELGLILVLGFLFVRFTFEPARRAFGRRWRIAGIDDPAALPLLVALLSVYMFLMTPVLNTIIRVNEAEADIYGLNASRQPEGFAEVALKLGEYRKLEPTPLEEAIFFDHPSGHSRILMAMRWKAAQLAAASSPASPSAVGYEPPLETETGDGSATSADGSSGGGATPR